MWDAVCRSGGWTGGGMTPRRLDRLAIRARLEDIPGWIVEDLLDEFEPAALKAMAIVDDKKQPKAKPSGGRDQSGDAEND